MQLWNIEPSKKVIFACLMAIFLMTMLPFATAHSGDTIIAPSLTVIPIIDGNWTGTEWDDAPQYNITGSGGTGYIRVKYDSNYLYIIIDSVWDLTWVPLWGSYEGTYVAFDTAHDGGTAPQTDDYLFFCGFSKWSYAWQGNGTQWMPIFGTGFDGEQFNGTSPNSGTVHRIDEMKIPLAYVGSIASSSGFYVIVRDDSSDPDGGGPNPPTAWVEWPTGAGGNPDGWPVDPGYIDPCPAPNAWGDLNLYALPVGGISTPVDKLRLLAPYIALVAAIGAVMIGVVYAWKHRFRKAAILKL